MCNKRKERSFFFKKRFVYSGSEYGILINIFIINYCGSRVFNGIKKEMKHVDNTEKE